MDCAKSRKGEFIHGRGQYELGSNDGQDPFGEPVAVYSRFIGR